MRITHRMIADTVNFNLQRSLNRLDKYSNQLSTGKVFQRPSENPVGVGRVMSYTSAVNRNEQFRLNMNQTSGWLDNTEFSLQNGLDALQRIRELSIYGANESLTAEDRRAIAPEVLEFINHLVGVANTETNGLYIFGGHQTLKAPFIREKIFSLDQAGNRVVPNPASGLNLETRNEVQLIDLGGATGGTFTLAFGGSSPTGLIDYDDTAGEIQLRLEALSTIGAGNVLVTNVGSDFRVEFVGKLADQDLGLLTFNNIDLVGAVAPGVSVPTDGDGREGLTASGLQNGNYTLGQSTFTSAAADVPGKVAQGQDYLQGSAQSIVGLLPENAWSDRPVPVTVEFNAASSLSLQGGFISDEPTHAFNLELTYDHIPGVWNYTDDTGVPQTFDPAIGSPFNHFGMLVDPSRLGGTPAGGETVTVTSIGTHAAVNASVLLEITAVDYETGKVDYIYTAHEYELDGTYSPREGKFSLQFGFGDSTTDQMAFLGSTAVNISGLGGLPVSTAAGLRVGDRSVINVTPALTLGSDNEKLTLDGFHRGGASQANFIFDENTLDGLNEIELHFFSLDTFERSLEKGRVYNGGLNLAYDSFSPTIDPALTFSYDSLGFPVYYGDNFDRIQEISPHQEMTMNLSGDKAFGENQQVFEAVIDVFWALIDNDREALGDGALAKMDDAVNHFLEKLAQVGARSNRVEAMHNTLFSENLYLREVRSNIEDIDLAYIISEFKMQESAYKAALSTASMMLQPSLVDYLR